MDFISAIGRIFNPNDRTLKDPENSVRGHAAAIDDVESQKRKARIDASKLSVSAAENPGDAHMGIPTAGGDSMGTLLKTLKSLFGAG